MPRRSPLALLVALLVVGPLSWSVRELEHRRLSVLGSGAWVSSDPDTLYQVRRVHRALTEGRVAGEDAYLNHPEGSPIPWPPYYAQLLATALGPFAPDAEDDSLRPWVEMRVASSGRVFGVLTTVLAVALGWWLAGGLGAGLAGGYHAVCAASAAYSKSGNGDHHALVALATGLVLALLSLGVARGALARRRTGWITGLAAGALQGGLLGVWVGAMIQLLAVELAFAWLIARSALAERDEPGLAPLGLGFHAGALLALLPAVLQSPWTAVEPWMVINLSWFHPAFLALGGLVFVPLIFLGVGSRARRTYPFAVAGALLLLFAVGALTPLGDGVRDGFAWVSRADRFMAGIEESRALVGPGRWAEGLRFVGYGALLLPFAWLALARLALGERAPNPPAGRRRGPRLGDRVELVPWAVAVPLFALQAARQGRFADALVLPLAVALAAGAAWLLERAREPAASLLGRGFGALGLGIALALLLNPQAAARAFERRRAGPDAIAQRERPAQLGARAAADWLRGYAPDRPGAVLASWSFGHLIEWAADRPSVATNFGSYVGVEGFEAPSRFFMEEDPAAAEAILEQRDARFVLVSSDLPNRLNRMIDVALPTDRARYAGPPNAQGISAPKPAWFRTLGARLLFDGEVVYPMGAPPDAPPWRQLDFLRLVYAAPQPDPARALRSPGDISPAALVWERVPGARLEARGAPGDVLEVSIEVRFAKARRGLVWRARAPVADDGLARLRVPYATETGPGSAATNGDGRVAPGAARWVLGGSSGALAIPERAVLEASVVRVP